MNSLLFRLVLTLLFCSCAMSSDYAATNSLDALVENSALQSLVLQRPHTGALYEAIVPANWSGMEVLFLRLRSRTLWREGTNFSGVTIPPRTLPIPHVKRLVIVYQNFRNWSSQYFAVPGYSLITSVVGFTVYDASNISSKSTTKLGLNTMGNPISIRFDITANSSSTSRGGRCVSYDANGTFYFSEMKSPNLCYVHDMGRFSIAVQPEKERRPSKNKKCWVIGLVLGFIGMILICYVGLVILRLSKSKKVQVMERQADDSELFETVWVGGSKMPCATVTRTQPVLENGRFEYSL